VILQSDKSPCARETAGGSAPCIGKGKERSICISRAQAKTSDSASPLPILGSSYPFSQRLRPSCNGFCPISPFVRGPELAKSLTLLTRQRQKCQTFGADNRPSNHDTTPSLPSSTSSMPRRRRRRAAPQTKNSRARISHRRAGAKVLGCNRGLI